ncbi:polyketide cyclase [Herbaspirillum rubrisubalbicans]|uniref:Polyketide cyclase n=1 Tax=Herbaspirillum rubrisubalbicans TaxID=80842 RepID=A0ABX9C8D7_9BURK|nr:nuclear transport factor 2 family protein [Herbaspirillum rubrisubalbicans]NQE47232.1 polyketide cyclase [Herbaspirillum rubrisubalbicans]RAM66815.1 polyketide cyclase [Herbaspirillum rubrisubalbicans]RAN47474.1 polyketide cyclase [Herbaspirillum rubrisubalbicans]
MTDADLLARLERVEARLAISQLPIRYALAVDGRDLDGLVALFGHDVECGRWGQGRAALRAFYDSGPVLRSFYRSIHQICGHEIELVDADHARGRVYCRAEHEDGGNWVVMAICYVDSYVRQDGQWLFERRVEQHWYATDCLERPGRPRLQNWPGKYDTEKFAPRLPHAFPTWARFWEASAPTDLARLTAQP